MSLYCTVLCTLWLCSGSYINIFLILPLDLEFSHMFHSKENEKKWHAKKRPDQDSQKTTETGLLPQQKMYLTKKEKRSETGSHKISREERTMGLILRANHLHSPRTTCIYLGIL